MNTCRKLIVSTQYLSQPHVNNVFYRNYFVQFYKTNILIIPGLNKLFASV